MDGAARPLQDVPPERLFALCAHTGGPAPIELGWELANPCGVRGAVAFDAHGEPEALLLARPLRVWSGGAEGCFVHVVGFHDAGARPGGLGRRSTFQRLGAALVAFRSEEDLVYTGLPDEGAWRSAKAALEAEVVATQVVLRRAVAPASARPATERLETFDHQARWLWERCCGPWPVSVLRDDRYLNWITFARPGRGVEVHGVRDGDGILRAYAVVRPAGDELDIVDWLCPPDEPAVGEALIAGLEARARALGAGLLTAVLPPWSPWFASFQRAGFRVHPSDAFLAVRSLSRRHDSLWLRDHFWVQPLDLDA